MADEILSPSNLPLSHPVTDPADHHMMGAKLSRHIEEGKGKVPTIPEPLVCKPRELEPWRVFKIMSEFVEGFELIQKYALAATFFGSNRVGFEHHYYQSATELAGRLAKRGFAVITGGSAGIMEAANKGAYEAGGASVGLNIHLNESQAMNKYVTEEIYFSHFFVRKVMLTFASEVYIYFPGGFGTLDEFFEIVTLIQTQKIKRIPVVLYGKEFWTPAIEGFRKTLLEKYSAIDPEDMEIFHIVDSVDEAFDYIVANTKC
ncbi:MAG TPA: TIGR00730 family Rossman fold protein [Candidatus Paceibacterota bacterium]|nr:TIGR00730 family Rossman fold protein [Candidatus Paceibacterota bacterium]